MRNSRTWRCPGCGAVQLETSECFVCGRSATSCATCANFRQSVAAGVGYCAIDRRREPLSGDEQRPCWTGGTDPGGDGLFALLPLIDRTAQSAPRGLVELRRGSSGN